MRESHLGLLYVSDITVLSRDEDDNAVKLKDILKKFSKGELTFTPEPLPGQSRFDALRRDLETSQYAFLFLDERCKTDGWMRFQQDAALMQCLGHSQYIVPVKACSQTPIPWFLQMYRVLELSALLKGRSIEDVQVERLKKDDIDESLMNALVTAIRSKNEKLVTSRVLLSVRAFIDTTENIVSIIAMHMNMLR